MVTVVHGRGKYRRDTASTEEYRLQQADFQVHIVLAPQERDSRQPVFSLEGLPGMRPIRRRQDPRRSRKFRPGHFAADGARRNLYPRIVSHPLGFPGVITGHHVKLVIFLAKPYRRGYRLAALAVCDQADVALPLKRCRETHRRIVLPGGKEGTSLLAVTFYSVITTATSDCPHARRCVTSQSCGNGCASA
jgi:hypothetical protein